MLVNTGWGLHMLPLDMLKIGQLYLNGGRWEGVPVLSEAWVNRSTANHTSISEDFDYGYQWWRFADGSSTARAVSTNDLFFAWGYGGQFIFVILATHPPPGARLILITSSLVMGITFFW